MCVFSLNDDHWCACANATVELQQCSHSARSEDILDCTTFVHGFVKQMNLMFHMKDLAPVAVPSGRISGPKFRAIFTVPHSSLWSSKGKDWPQIPWVLISIIFNRKITQDFMIQMDNNRTWESLPWTENVDSLNIERMIKKKVEAEWEFVGEVGLHPEGFIRFEQTVGHKSYLLSLSALKRQPCL